MKCIDAVEGTVKCILKQLHTTHKETSSDDSEYITKVKTVIDATDDYIQNNPEFIQDPIALQQVLYTYSRKLWLNDQQIEEASRKANSEEPASSNADFQTYYYDYLYDRGVYPN